MIRPTILISCLSLPLSSKNLKAKALYETDSRPRDADQAIFTNPPFTRAARGGAETFWQAGRIFFQRRFAQAGFDSWIGQMGRTLVCAPLHASFSSVAAQETDA